MTNMCCRACLGITPKMVSIFEPYRSSTIAHIINSFTDIKITENHKNFPNRLCSLCLEELELVINFMNKCKDTDKSLRSVSHQIPDEPCKLEVKEESKEIKEEEYLFDESDSLECDINNSLVDDKDMLDVDFKEQAKNSVLEPALREPTPNYYECHDCGERLRTKCKLRVHWKRSHNFSFTCEKCKRVFKAYQTFKKHSQRGCVNPNIVKIVVEGKKRRFCCRFCDYETVSYNNLRIHSYSHTGEREYACNLCSKTFTQWSSLYGHKEAAHQIYRVEITCETCGKHIKGRRKWYQHLQTHLNTRFQCDICKTFLKSKKILKIHMKKHYFKKENISAACEICGKVFTCHTGLQRHSKLIHFTTNHSCKMCKYQHKNIAFIRRHERRHFQENMLQCSLCYNFFDGQEKIDRHLHVIHGSKTHICVFCERGFMKRHVLLKHQARDHAEQLKSHTGLTYIRHNRKNVKKAQDFFLFVT